MEVAHWRWHICFVVGRDGDGLPLVVTDIPPTAKGLKRGGKVDGWRQRLAEENLPNRLLLAARLTPPGTEEVVSERSQNIVEAGRDGTEKL